MVRAKMALAASFYIKYYNMYCADENATLMLGGARR